MTRIHLRSAALFLVFPIAAIALILVDGCLGTAYAQTPPTTAAATAGLDTMTILVLLIAVLTGLGTITGGIAMILHAISVRTKTTLDDRAAVVADTVHGRIAAMQLALEQLIGIVRVLAPQAATVVANQAVPPAAAPPTAASTSSAGPAVLVLVLGLLAGGVSLPSCASSTRTDTLHAALITVDTTEAAFLSYDKSHQAQIVATATSHAQGEVALAAYEAKAAKVAKAIKVALHAIAALGDINDDPHIAGVKAALGELAAAWSDLTGGPK